MKYLCCIYSSAEFHLAVLFASFGNIWYSGGILWDIEHFVHGQSSSGKPHVGQYWAKNALNVLEHILKILKNIINVKIYMQDTEMFIYTGYRLRSSCQLLSSTT